MKTSTLIVSVSLTASVLLLAVPRKGAATDSNGDGEAAFVPKVRHAQAAAPKAHAKQLTAQRSRLPLLDWQRDPFEPIAPTPWPVEPASPVPIPLPPATEPAVEPEMKRSPAEEPLPPTPPTRSGPLPVLTGISQSGAHRYAIVDRAVVEEGDTLPSGDVVMGIGIRAVTLRSSGEIVVIRLGNGQ